jgi:acetylornithine deacetylase/succinyl-diaminopimelate desuccinylase-like protein
MKTILSFIFFSLSFCLFSQNMKIQGADGNPISIEGLLQEYIQIPSVSGNEKDAGNFLKSVCENNNLHIADFGSENGNYNFAASIFPLSSGKPNIIFLNHIDVVPESFDPETKPYSGRIEDETIYGRGAIDNKGAAMMQLYGILLLTNNQDVEQSPYNVTFLAVSCEETQCAGGAAYVKENFTDILNPAVVFGEGPSELTSLIDGDFEHPVFGISVIHKRVLWLNLEIESTTNGHGSITPNDYANKQMIAALDNLIGKKRKAIYNEVNTKFLKDLGDQHKGGKKMVLKHPKLFKPFVTSQLRKHPELFSLFSNTITVTNLYSDSNAVNKLSMKAGAQLDCRLLPETDEKEFMAMIKKLLDDDSIKITVIKSQPKMIPSGIETIFFKNLSLAIEEKYPGSTTIDMMMPNVNDLGLFRLDNIPAYGTMPIFCDFEEVRCVHGKNEHLHLGSLYDASEVYYSFLKKMIAPDENKVKLGLGTN